MLIIKGKVDAMRKKGLWPYRIHAAKEEFKHLPKRIDGMAVCETDLIPCAMIEAVDALSNVKFEEVEF